MPKSDIEFQKHITKKIILTRGLDERLNRVAKEIGCRKSALICRLLTDVLDSKYGGV